MADNHKLYVIIQTKHDKLSSTLFNQYITIYKKIDVTKKKSRWQINSTYVFFLQPISIKFIN